MSLFPALSWLQCILKQLLSVAARWPQQHPPPPPGWNLTPSPLCLLGSNWVICSSLNKSCSQETTCKEGGGRGRSPKAKSPHLPPLIPLVALNGASSVKEVKAMGKVGVVVLCPSSLTHMQAPAGTALSWSPGLFLTGSLSSRSSVCGQWAGFYDNCTCKLTLCSQGMLQSAGQRSLQAGPSVTRSSVGSPGLQLTELHRPALPSLAVGLATELSLYFLTYKMDGLLISPLGLNEPSFVADTKSPISWFLPTLLFWRPSVKQQGGKSSVCLSLCSLPLEELGLTVPQWSPIYQVLLYDGRYRRKTVGSENWQNFFQWPSEVLAAFCCFGLLFRPQD